MCWNKEQKPCRVWQENRKSRSGQMQMEACVVIAQEIAREIFTVWMSRSYVDILYWALFPCQVKGEIWHLVDIWPYVRVWLQHVTWDGKNLTNQNIKRIYSAFINLNFKKNKIKTLMTGFVVQPGSHIAPVTTCPRCRLDILTLIFIKTKVDEHATIQTRLYANHTVPGCISTW